MKLLYNGVDITANVDISKALIKDNAGGMADSVDILFSDTEKLWRDWAPQKGDRLELQEGGFSSGLMYVDEAGIVGGKFSVRAISTPLTAKTPKSKSWENIRFVRMASDLAGEVGLVLETYNITDQLYDRIDQVERPNLDFLNERCQMEGCCLKITDGKAIIYDEKTLEQADPAITLTEDVFIGDYAFKTVSSGLYSSCEVVYLNSKSQLIQYHYSPRNAPIGPVLRPKVRAASQGEAERYAKGMLRAVNKYETTGFATVQLNTSLAAGNVADVKEMGSFSGRYFIYSAIHNLTGGKTLLYVRKILEGY